MAVDIAIGALILGYCAFIIYRRKKNGGAGSCSGCGGSCAGCAGCGVKPKQDARDE